MEKIRDIDPGRVIALHGRLKEAVEACENYSIMEVLSAIGLLCNDVVTMCAVNGLATRENAVTCALEIIKAGLCAEPRDVVLVHTAEKVEVLAAVNGGKGDADADEAGAPGVSGHNG